MKNILLLLAPYVHNSVFLFLFNTCFYIFCYCSRFILTKKLYILLNGAFISNSKHTLMYPVLLLTQCFNWKCICTFYCMKRGNDKVPTQSYKLRTVYIFSFSYIFLSFWLYFSFCRLLSHFNNHKIILLSILF